jgi:rhodanese-related sulfurtransferase
MMLGYFAFTKGWIFNDFENISIDEAKILIERDKSLVVLDVRSVSEYQKDYIGHAINIPFVKLEKNWAKLNRFKSQKILVYSERGELSVRASRLLSKEGFNIVHLKGGMVFWIRMGYVVSKP